MNQPPDFDSNLSPSPQQNLGQSVAGSTVEGPIQGIQGDYNTQIHITNYYYSREDIRTAPVESAKTSADDNLPCPYRGLFHFGPNDTEFFFGREVFIEELVQATAKRSFIPVLGASGSGKSSVVLAGLVPKLQQQGHWLFTHFRPGSDPFYALAEALVPLYTPDLDATERMAQTPKLADYLDKGEVTLTKVMANIRRSHPNHQVLLIADQFEEIYTLCNDESTRRRFLDCLLSLIQTNTNQLPTVLVATMRADFLGSALEYRPFADVLQDDIKLGPMNRTELLEVIEKPAQKLGVTLEAGLVKRILDDVENEPGNLPLLEFALTLLWERRSDRQLTHAAYEAIGEVQGALASHADKIYNNFNAADQQQVQRIFMQLVRPGEGTEDTRRIATKSELGAASWLSVSQLADARLVVTSRNSSGQETVEVVHEALIREWTRVREWMNEHREFRTWQELLRTRMRQWEDGEKDEGSLLRGVPLAEAEDSLGKRYEELSEAERKFIQESVALREKEKKEEERRRKEKAHLQRRINFGLAGFSLVALTVAGVAWWQQRVTEAEGLGVMALNNFESGAGEIDALVSALEAGQKLKTLVFWNSQCLQDCPATNPLLALQKILDNIHQTNQINTYQKGVNSIRFIQDGKQIATAGEDGTVKWWDLKGNRLRNPLLHEKENSIKSLDFSQDETLLVTGASNGSVKLWDLSKNQRSPVSIASMYHKCHNGQELRENQLPENKDIKCSVNNVRFLSKSNLLATTGNDGTLRLWHLNGENILTKDAHKGSIKSLNPSPDDLLLATAGEDGMARLWDLSGKLQTGLKGHECSVNPEQRDTKKCSVNSVWFHPNKNQLATAGDDGTVRLWDFSGKELAKFEAHQEGVEVVRISRDGQRIATAGKNGTVRLWDLNGTLQAEFKGHQGSVVSIRFDKNATLATAGKDDGTVRFWQISDKPLTKLKGHKGSVNSVRFSPHGKQLATAGDDDTVRLWDLKGKQKLQFPAHQGGINSVRFQPKHGSLLATGGKNSTIKLWKHTGELVRSFERRHSKAVRSINFNSNGNELATASDDGTARRWNLDGKELVKFEHQGKVETTKLSPDDKLLTTVGEDRAAFLWDINGKLKKVLKGHKGSVNTANFSPNENKLATAGDDGTIKLWGFSGKQLNEFKIYQGRITQITFSWDGKLLSTSSATHKVGLLNLSGQQLAEFTGHQDIIVSADFSPDGKLLATASKDGTAIVWRIRRLDELLSEGCLWLQDYLATHPEEQQKLHVCHEVIKKTP